MATRPEKLTRWATGGGADVSEPAEAKKDAGHVDNDEADTGEHNWLRRNAYEVERYLDERIDVAGPASNARLFGLEYTGSGLTLSLSAGALVVAGERIHVSATDLSTSGNNSHAFTNEATTYVAMNASKAFEYNQVALGAAPPTPTAGYVHFERVDATGGNATPQSVNGRLAGTLARGHVVTRSIAVEGETGRAPILGVHNPAAGNATIELGTNALMRAKLVAGATSLALESWDGGAKIADALTVANASAVVTVPVRLEAKNVTSAMYNNGSAGASITIDWVQNGRSQKISLNANCTATLGAAPGDGTYNLLVEQTTGSHTLSISGATQIGQAGGIHTAAGAKTLCRLERIDGTWFVEYVRTTELNAGDIVNVWTADGGAQDHVIDISPTAGNTLICVVAQASAGDIGAVTVSSSAAWTDTGGTNYSFENFIRMFSKQADVFDAQVTVNVDQADPDYRGNRVVILELASTVPLTQGSKSATDATPTGGVVTASAVAGSSTSLERILAAVVISHDEALDSGRTWNDGFSEIYSAPPTSSPNRPGLVIGSRVDTSPTAVAVTFDSNNGSHMSMVMRSFELNDD